MTMVRALLCLKCFRTGTGTHIKHNGAFFGIWLFSEVQAFSWAGEVLDMAKHVTVTITRIHNEEYGWSR